MSRHTEYEQKTEDILRPIAAQCGVDIYDVEYVKEGSEYYLRAYIDKEGGVNIGDCETVSRGLSDALDEHDFIPDAYILEVSSPGLGRKLTKDRHLEKSIGEEIEIRFYKPPDGFKDKELAGILTGYDPENITVMIDDSPYTFERKTIARINLALDF